MAKRGAAAGVGRLALLLVIAAGPTSTAAAAAAAAASTDSTTAALPAPQPAEWETLDTGLPEEARLAPAGSFRYNRVDGPAISAGLAVVREDMPRPILRAAVGYAFSRERVLGEFSADVPLGHARPPAVTLGGSGYRRTATEDAWIVDDAENTIFALLSRKDYRDWYESEGFEGRLRVDPGRDVSLAAGARVERHRSLGVETRVALWGVDDLFRENPAIDEGEEGLAWGSVRVGPERIPTKGGSRIEVRYERAGDPIERDFDYARIRAQGNLRQRLAPGQTFRVRAIAASTRSGTLPAQKIWDLGGIGTLRGEPYKRYSGDQFYLVNAEFSYLFRKNLNALAFLDWGAAWFGRHAWGESRPALDGGVGIRVADGPLVVTVARNLQRSDAPYLVGLRMGGSWE